MTIAVTGATGSIGGRVLERLGGGAGVRFIGRNAERLGPLAEHFDSAFAVATYADGPAMTAALDGVRLLFLVSGHESATRRDEYRTAVDAAHAAGVERIVYLSFLGAAPECTFTFGPRPLLHGAAHPGERAEVHVPAGQLVSVDDPADGRRPGRHPGPGRRRPGERRRPPTTSPTLRRRSSPTGNGDHDGVTYRLTGPEVFTLSEAAETITRVTGRSVRFENETLDEAYASRAHFGAPDFEVAGWVTSYAAIAAGELAVVTGDVELLTGRPLQTFADHLNSYTYPSWHSER